MHAFTRYTPEEGSPDMREDEPVIFLDIDGVLNTRRHLIHLHDNEGATSLRDRHGLVFDPVAVDALTEIIEQSDAAVVISSTWRIMMSLNNLHGMWEERELPGSILDITPILRDAPRGWEIYRWLGEHRHHEFHNYLILDDDSDMLLWQKDNFIHTSGETGVGPEHVADAVRILTQSK